MLRRIAPLFFWLFLLQIFCACAPVHGADATSFDPTLVTVKAKGTSSIPVGTIIAWPVATNPSDWQNSDGTYNWLECNGQSISASVYPELFAVVGPQVPDLRGLFLRGLGGNSAALGVQQGDAVKAHTHNTVAGSWTAWLGEGHSSHSHYTFAMGGGGQTTASGGVENRPINMAVRYLVRARP